MSQFPNEQGEDGSFKRQDDAFREFVGVDTDYPPVAGRYHLYLCKACPWAHRTWIVLRFMGLEDAIGTSFADPIRDERGWAFREGDGHGPDRAEGFQFLSEAYRATRCDFVGRVTVPVLWDRDRRRIVNNSEDDICRMLNDAFRPLARHPVELFPKALDAAQRSLSDAVYRDVNNGVYQAGFADNQDAYEEAVTRCFRALEDLEDRLGSGGPYLFGTHPVETDLRLFCTLIRFDVVYHGHFKCNLRRIIDLPNLQRFMERIYRHPAVTDTVSFDQIKRHYYVTHDDINPTRIVPKGPLLDWI